MLSGVSPVVKSIFLCDLVEADRQSGKLTVQGVFNSLRVPFVENAVSVLDDFCSFTEFTGGVSDAVVRLEIVQAGTNAVVLRTSDRVLRFPGRHTTVAVSFRVSGLAVAEPGVYFVELYCNDQFVDDRVLSITAREED